MQATRCTIAIPAYNEAHCLDALLCRLVDETSAMDGVEILVCDNASQDRSGEIALEWAARCPRVRLITEPKPGKPRAWNALMRAASADVVVFFDADVWPHRGALAQILAAMEQPEAIACAGTRRFVGQGILPRIADPVIELCLAGNFYAVRRKAILARMRQFGYLHMPDVFAEDIWLQSLLKAGEMARVDAAVEIVVDRLESYLELQARKRLVWHELLRHYPVLATRLAAEHPEALQPLPQLSNVLCSNTSWRRRARWVGGALLKAAINLAFTTQLRRMATGLEARLHASGGASVLREFTLRRQFAGASQ